jgi:hypothetical protein
VVVEDLIELKGDRNGQENKEDRSPGIYQS